MVEPFIDSSLRDEVGQLKLPVRDDGTLPSWRVTPFTGGIDEKQQVEQNTNSQAANEGTQSSTQSASEPGVIASAINAAPTVDIVQRIFEDRRFESHLLNFLVQRMDPRQASREGNENEEEFEGSVVPPPTYREDRTS